MRSGDRSSSISLKDGHLVVFKREDGRSPFFQYRAYLGHRRYKRGSTGEVDQGLAIEAALKIFAAIKTEDITAADPKVIGPILQRRIEREANGALTFEEVARTYLDSLSRRANRRDDGIISESSQRFHRYVTNLFLIPFFGKLPMRAITDEDISSWQEWRWDYWSEKPADKLGRGQYRWIQIGKIRYKAARFDYPSLSQQNNERTVLRAIIDKGFDLGCFPNRHAIPFVKHMKRRPNPRGWFPPADLDRLLMANLCRIQQAKRSSDRRRWQLLQHYICLALATGMRPQELRLLNWGDVRIHSDAVQIAIPEVKLNQGTIDLGSENERPPGNAWGWPVKQPSTKPEMPPSLSQDQAVLLTARGKTEPRDLVAKQAAYKTLCAVAKLTLGLPNIRELSARFQSTPVFPHSNYRESFKGLVIDAFGRDKDNKDRPLSPYSLRSTHICYALLEGQSIYDIATNCGTSPSMIITYYSKIESVMKADVLKTSKAGSPFEILRAY